MAAPIWSEMVTLSVFLDGILAGIFLGSSLVEHSARHLDAVVWMAYKQAKERVFGPLMPALFGSALVLAIAATPLSGAHLAFGCAAILLCGVLVITFLIHLPLNALFQTWTATAFPSDWSEARRRWRNWSWLRCALTVCAFGAAVIGET